MTKELKAINKEKCPECDGPISKSRTKIPTTIPGHPFIYGSWFYYCKNPECLWPCPNGEQIETRDDIQ